MESLNNTDVKANGVSDGKAEGTRFTASLGTFPSQGLDSKEDNTIRLVARNTTLDAIKTHGLETTYPHFPDRTSHFRAED